jgi:hypothetical protein
MEDRKLRTCAGCMKPIEAGQEASVLVTAAGHAITVYAHDEHREAAHANTMGRSDWKRSDSFRTK